MTYDEACEMTLTRKQVVAFIRDHDLNPFDFFDDTSESTGDRDKYDGKVVLDWLGY